MYSTVWCRRTCCRRTARLDYQDFLRTCQARTLKIRTGWIIVCEMCADLALCTTLKRAALIADKNANQLELRKLRTVPGYNAGPHVLQHPTVYCTVLLTKCDTLFYTMSCQCYTMSCQCYTMSCQCTQNLE